MTDWLAAFVHQRIEEVAREAPHLRAAMDEAGGILLFGTIGGEAFLRPDGSVWYHWAVDWVHDPEHYEWSEATGKDRWGALVLGARRMPELKQLLPRRSPDSPDCSRCVGSGLVLVGVLCPDCGGLGWIAEGAA